MQFVIPGRPQQRGSKRAFPIKKKDGRIGVAVADMNARSTDWMHWAKLCVMQKYYGLPIDGPIGIRLEFFFARPKSHYRSGKYSDCIKDSAPLYHVYKPDLAKLIRCAEDAMTGILWKDDCQVCQYLEGTGKYWTPHDEKTIITVAKLDQKIVEETFYVWDSK